ncbi:MAG TPA: BadF/BadG/BcrA/BcrD ATPase family protein [Pseudonocardiaceae bacterium]|jgi:N-acetylglucosamine kinase-like BadF-type ATPase|nr:BadF/BadG/BcrA/BcrD ATPase family protein [Pseudonocardiaceae bacterium]
MSRVIAGFDAGGTKLAVRVETVEGRRLADLELPAQGWSAAPVEAAANWLRVRLARVLPVAAEVVAIGVGAQGCDTREHCAALAEALSATGIPAVVVNDAALLVPAAGLTEGIGVIAGTGAIGVGRDPVGNPLFAGGWGWIIGDEAGSAGIVRLATVAALTAHDDDEPDDGLLSALQKAFGVADPPALARVVNDEPTTDNWGPRAPAVFAAADAGSALAVGVIDTAAAHLATLVDRLLARGAVGTEVVAGGSVIVGQPRLAGAFRARLGAARPELHLCLLTEPPVAGAIALARSRLVER